MNDVLPVVNVTAVDVRVRFMVAQAMGDPAGDGPGADHRVERELIFNTGAECGGDHIKQAADDGVPAARPVMAAA